MDVSESSLIWRAKKGDADCLAELIQIHSSRAFAAAFAILRNRQDAEEAFQDAAIQAVKSIRELRNESAFRTWFIKIVVNRAIDRLRYRQRELKRIEPLTELNSSVPSEDIEMHMDLVRTVALLPPDHQAVIQLYYTEGYRTPQIAQLLEKPEGTIRRLLSESYRMLRLHLREGYEPRASG